MQYIYDNGTIVQTTLIVNGVPFPPPAMGGFEIVRQQLVSDSQRTASGKATANLVRSNVYKHQFNWNYLTTGEVTRMINAVGDGLWLTVAFLDITNEWKTIIGYHGDISYVPHMILATGLYDGATTSKFNFIEQ